jgi:hypothetical protein
MALDRGGVGQHGLGLDQHAARSRGDFHAVPMTVEQLGAEPPFECLDASADRCLLGIELCRRGAEAAGFCNSQEKAHIVPVPENVGDLGLAWRRGEHRYGRYNKIAPGVYLGTGSYLTLSRRPGNANFFRVS